MRRIPWSAISLLYPLLAMLYIWTRIQREDPDFSGNTLLVVLSYGISNIGYVLLGAGIFAGTFRIFGLTKRWKVFLAGAVAWIVGAVLTNVGFRMSG